MNAPTVDEIQSRYAALLAALREAAAGGGHDPDALRIVGVTKTHPVDVVQRAIAAGIERLGESRVQEAEPKIAAAPGAQWHFIGRLQSNKVRRAVAAFAVIHSADSPELLARIDRLAGEARRTPDVLIQVDLAAGDEGRGFDPAALATVQPPVSARLIGLMTIAALGASADEARGTFRRLRELRDGLEQRLGHGLPELSMGMSADAVPAAAEGATLIRIGTALFGPRA